MPSVPAQLLKSMVVCLVVHSSTGVPMSSRNEEPCLEKAEWVGNLGTQQTSIEEDSCSDRQMEYHVLRFHS